MAVVANQVQVIMQAITLEPCSGPTDSFFETFKYVVQLKCLRPFLVSIL